MLEKVKQSASFLKRKTNYKPEVGIVLGTGLGGLVAEYKLNIQFQEEIPNFPISPVEGHSEDYLW